MKLKMVAALCTFVFTGSAFANVVVKETDKFQDVAQKVEQLTIQGKKPLVVMDIDNTLLTSTSDLGGDIWYQWQSGKLDIKPSDADKVDCLFEDSIGLLYELVPMKLIEQDVPAMVRSWQDNGITVMALSSRSPNYRYATEREMVRNQFDMTRTALKEKGANSLPIYIDNPSRPLSYINGIMMTTGMNKGTMLEYLLDKTGQSFSDVIFVDDSNKNVSNLEKTYKNNPALDMTIFHYTKIEHDRIAADGTILTKEQADKMAKDWQALNKVLEQIAPARASDMCLGR